MSTVVQDESVGMITQVIGPVDVEFPGGELPEIYDALIVEDTSPTKSFIELQRFGGFWVKTE